MKSNEIPKSTSPTSQCYWSRSANFRSSVLIKTAVAPDLDPQAELLLGPDPDPELDGSGSGSVTRGFRIRVEIRKWM
jgi:hypothetical protein